MVFTIILYTLVKNSFYRQLFIKTATFGYHLRLFRLHIQEWLCKNISLLQIRWNNSGLQLIHKNNGFCSYSNPFIHYRAECHFWTTCTKTNYLMIIHIHQDSSIIWVLHYHYIPYLSADPLTPITSTLSLSIYIYTDREIVQIKRIPLIYSKG